MEQLSFPLPVNDMNMEIISYLDDDSLYNLCKTSTYSQLLCESPDVWSVNRPSELAPLNFLRPLYKNWIDFYENVRNDYVYVIVDKMVRNTIHAVYLVDNIRLAAEHVLSKIGIKGSVEQLNYDLSQYVKTGRSYEIGFARKNVQYDSLRPYDYMLYQVGHRDIGSHMPSFLLCPSLSSTQPLMLAKKSRGLFSRNIAKADELYYCNYNGDNLSIIEEKGYIRLRIGNIPVEKIECERVLDYPIFKFDETAIFRKLKIDVFIVPDRVIDGTDNFFVVTVPRPTSPNTKAMTLETLKRDGTFYKSEDLFVLLDALNKRDRKLHH